MSIRIEIELREGEDLRSKLAAAMPQLFEQQWTVEQVMPPEPAPLPTTLHERVAAAEPLRFGDPNTVPVIQNGEVVGVEPAPAKTRGRPRKDGTPAQPRPAPEPKAPEPQVFTVRRYAGHIEGEFSDSGEAADKLAELIKLANSLEALNDLEKHNAEELRTWPEERVAEITEIFDALRMQMASDEPEPEPAAPGTVEAPGPHKGLDGKPLEKLFRTKPSARDAVQAYATALGPTGLRNVLDKFAELGMQSVSSIADDDPRHGQVVEWLAPKLGVPVA